MKKPGMLLSGATVSVNFMENFMAVHIVEIFILHVCIIIGIYVGSKTKFQMENTKEIIKNTGINTFP